jgi:hypothetical protein
MGTQPCVAKLAEQDAHNPLSLKGSATVRRDLDFRVFVSSAFSDLIAERNALQESVWPKLRRYCQERKARFQAIDL